MRKFTILFFLIFTSLLAFTQSNIYFYANNTYGCGPLAVTFTNGSYIDGNVEGPVSYNWTVDGETASSSDTSFVDTLSVGYHYIGLEVFDINGYSVGEYMENIDVSGNPQVFWMSSGNLACPGEEITFGFDWSGEGEYNAYWNFGDNSPVVNGNGINHQFSDEGTYSVKLIVSSYCGVDSVIQDISVSSTAVPDVIVYTENGDYHCPGDVVKFKTSGNYSSYNWIFGDGEVSYNPGPMHAFKELGQYYVKLIAENVCGNAGVDSVLININGDLTAGADFYYWPDYACPGEMITFQSNSEGTHIWDLGNGVVKQVVNPMVAYADTGDYMVTHILTNGCGYSDTVSKPLSIDYTYETVYDNISFKIEDKDEYDYEDTIWICPGEELVFRNNTGNSDLSYLWIFSDGDEIEGYDATKVFNEVDVYHVYLRAMNKCMGEGYSSTRTIVVDSSIKPKASLSASPRYICPGEMVYFWDEDFEQTKNYNTYDILFGDGNQSLDIAELENTDFYTLDRHIYADVGDYEFQFVVENVCNNTDTLSGTIHVGTDNTIKPSYYVSNSTVNDYDKDPDDWSMMNEATDHKFSIPIQWPYWTSDMNDYFYVYFWYGMVDLMSDDEEVGPPSGVVVLQADDIVIGDTAVAYVPFSAMEPEVTIAVAWYCDTTKAASIEPNAYTMPMDEFYNPISSFELIPGGDTEITNTLVLPEFTGDCDAVKLDGYYASDLGAGQKLFLDFWEDDYDGIMYYNLYVAADQYSSGAYYLSSGEYSYLNADTIEFVDYSGDCTGPGTYIFSQSNDTLYFIGVDACYNRDTALNQHAFVSMEYDDYYDVSGCPGDPVKFMVAGGIEYQWYFGDGETSTEQIAYHAYQDSGHYNAFVVVKNACGREDTVFTPVEIGRHNLPEAYFYLSDYNIDTDEAVYFYIEQWGDDNSDPNTYYWEFGDGTSSTVKEPSHIFEDGGSYQVTLEVTNGCGTSYAEQSIYVNKSDDGCDMSAEFNFKINGDTVRFFESVTGTLPTKYKWEFSDGTISLKPNPVKVFANSGAYSVCLTVYDSLSGCADYTCQDFIIGNVDCYADFEFMIDVDANSVQFEDVSPSATEWFWNFGDNEFSAVQNPLHYYDQPGYYDVTLRMYSESSNCDNIITKRIFVGYQDSVDCFVEFSYEVEDLTVSFIADVSDNITGGFWQFGDGTVLSDKDVTHTYSKPGEYKVCATVFDTINGCQQSICKTIIVGQVDCQAKYTFVINDDYSVDFYNESVGLNLEYYWDFGDGYFSGQFEPVHQFAVGEVYSVCLAINDTVLDCYSDYCVDIVIADSTGTTDCTPEMSYFIQNTTFEVTFDEVSGQDFTEYYWDFGDGTFSNLKTPKHVFGEEGVYDVCLQAYNDSKNCGGEICEKVIIQDANTTIVSVNADFGYFVNQLTDIVTFTDKSTGNVTSRYWTFGDGKMAADSLKIKHYYQVPKSYEVCLIAVDEDNGLKSKVCKNVIVGTEECNLTADFSYVIDQEDNLIKFINNTKGTANKWFWNFDDGTTSQNSNPYHMYTDPGFYLVKLGARDTISGCNDTHFELIQVGTVECKALFDYEVDPDSLTVKFANSSRGDIADFYWYFGDHSSSNEENPVKKYQNSGLYQVALAVNNSTGNCSDYVVVPIQVGEVSCEADFEVFIDSLQNVAYFENNSIGNIDRFRWFFGDGYQSVLENPVHFYPAPGYYTVSLVTASDDCMSKAEETILIGAQGLDCQADFYASIDENSQTVKFVDQSLGENLAYLWNFGDGTTSTEQDPEYTYESGGYYNVCLTVINGSGISNTICKFIQVSTEEYNSCFADFIYTVDSTSKTVEFTDLSAGNPNRWIWDFGDGISSNEQDPSHTYADAGYYRVKLVSGDTITGCASLTFALVNVSESATGIVAGFGYQVDSLSLKGTGKPVDFVGVSSGNSSNFAWDFGDGNTDSTSLTPTNVYTESGTYEVCFTVSDPITGMSNTYCDEVDVQLATDIEELFDESYSLLVYPNPFNEEMRIRYNIDRPSDVTIEVYDELGRLVDVIVQEYKYEGNYEVVWRNKSINNGIYNLRMSTNTGVVRNIRIIKN